ncbi:MAG: hypothetical protein ACHQQQ_00230 [Bacteroidota bacterium]
MNWGYHASICILSLSLIYGCDIFQTREPQQPTQGTSTYQVPDQPDVVLTNLEAAIHESNTDNYMRCFADTSSTSQPFSFTPSADVSSYESVFRTWNLSNERTYFQNLGKPVNGTPYLYPSSAPNQIFSSTDSVVYSMDYTFFYPHNRPGIPQLVRGKMELHLKPDARRLWYIQAWIDTKTTHDSTWSYIKAVFSAN